MTTKSEWDQFAPVKPESEWDQFAPVKPKAASTGAGAIPVDPNAAQAPAPLTPKQRFADRPVSDQISGGIFETLNRTAVGLKGLLPGVETTEDDRRRLEQHRQFVEGTGPASSIASGATDVALSFAPVAKAGQGLTAAARVARLGGAAPLVGDIAANAAYSAATAPEDRGTAAAFGAGGAVVGRMLPSAMARLLRPTTAGPEAKKLMEAGIEPTFGQVLSEKGGVIPRAIARAEETATSVPFAGAPIRKSRERAMDQFQAATREAALPPGAVSAAAGSVDELGDAFNQVYNTTLRGTGFIPNRNPFARWKLDDVIADEARGRPLTSAARNKAQGTVESIIDAMDPATMHTPEGAQFLERRLKDVAYKYKASPDPDAKEYGDLLADVASNWRKEWRGSLPPDKAAALGEIDKAFAKFIPVRRAAATGSLTNPDAYTPQVLLRAIRAGDKTMGKSNFLRGDLPQQELATAANKVLGSKVPDSGTAERLMIGGGLGGISYGAGLLPPTALAGTALALYGTAPVQRYLTSNTAAQKWLTENISKMSPVQQEQYLRRIYQTATQGGRSAATQGR